MFAKSLAVSAVALALASPSTAQVGFWELPICQQNCVIQMLDQSSALGCAYTGYGQPDVSCLCSQANFENGLRDCIAQSCTAEWDNYDMAYVQVCGRQLLLMPHYYYYFQGLILCPASAPLPFVAATGPSDPVSLRWTTDPALASTPPAWSVTAPASSSAAPTSSFDDSAINATLTLSTTVTVTVGPSSQQAPQSIPRW